MSQDQKIFNTIPVGSLGLVNLKSCQSLGAKVDQYLVDWRNKREDANSDTLAYRGYKQDSYVLDVSTPRFGSGEAKCVIKESVRGKDLFILVDVCNYSLTYTVCGHENHMSPDDHFADLKRVIAATSGKARRITFIMPF